MYHFFPTSLSLKAFAGPGPGLGTGTTEKGLSALERLRVKGQQGQWAEGD